MPFAHLHLLFGAGDAAGLQPADYTIGGIAVAVIGLAGTTVKLVLGMLTAERDRSEKDLATERARGDRLETSAMQAIPALTAASLQQQQSNQLLSDLGRRVFDQRPGGTT